MYSLDSADDETPLIKELRKRSNERLERRAKQAEEERQRLEQQELIRTQLEVRKCGFNTGKLFLCWPVYYKKHFIF